MKVDTSNLTRKTAFVISYNIFGAVFGYIALFFVMRSVGQAGWGIVGAAMGLVGLLAIFSDLGTSSTHIKKVGEGGNTDIKNGTYITLKLIYTNIFLVISFLAIFVSEYFGFSFESNYLRQAVILVIFYYYISSLSSIFTTILRANMKTSYALLPDFIRVIVQDFFLISLSLYWLSNPILPPEEVGVFFVYGYVIAAFAQLLTVAFLAKDIKVSRPTKDLIKTYILFSIPLIFLGAIAAIQANTDKAMLQFFWNTKEVGAYFGIQKILVPILTLSAALNFVVFPAQSHNYAQDKKRFMNITYTAERYISLMIIPIITFLFVFAPEVLNIWRVSLVSYAPVLRILLVYSFFYVINTPYSSQLVSAGHPKENLKAGVVQATLNVILNTLFIPSSILSVPLFGMKSEGAALATLISLLAGFFIIRYRAHKILDTKFNRRILIHLASAIVAGILIFFINQYIYHFVRFYELIIASGIFALVYFGILLFVREITVSEIKEITIKLLSWGAGK